MMARAKKNTESTEMLDNENTTETAMIDEADLSNNEDVDIETADNLNADETFDENMFEPMTAGLTVQITNHGNRLWVQAIKQWIENGQSFITFEDENQKQRLISILTQFNVFADYDRFEWVG